MGDTMGTPLIARPPPPGTPRKTPQGLGCGPHGSQPGPAPEHSAIGGGGGGGF